MVTLFNRIGNDLVVLWTLTGCVPCSKPRPLVYDRLVWKAKYARPKSVPYRPSNQFTPERELLGRTFFFHPRLPGSKSTSCATCHNAGFFWGDGLPKMIGRGMKELTRRPPAILSAAWADLPFWDARAESLEAQVPAPTLGNVAERAPYTRDGSERTLQEVVDLYHRGGRVIRIRLASEVYPLHLPVARKATLIEFLKTLTSDDKRTEVPVLPR